MPNRPRGLAALAVLVIAVSSAACSAGDPVAPLLGDRNEDGIVRIACLGDSNTQRPQDGDTWCELLEDLADLPEPTRTFNAGVGGAMIQPTVRELPNPPESYRGAAGSGTWAIFDGHGQLGFALEQPGALDYAVAAFGTNDLRAGADSDLPAQTDPAAIVRWYQVLRERAAREDVLLLVARTPPVHDETRSLMTDTVDIPGAASGAIQALNDLIDERFPPEVVIDFRSFRESGMLPSPSSFVDRLHLSPKAHRHRAEEALARLRSLRSLERYAFTFRLPAPEADGGERLDAAQLHPPRLISSSIPLLPDGGHVAAFRLSGDLFLIDFDSLAGASLRLPLTAPPAPTRSLTLSLRVHDPNGAHFDEAVSGDLSTRPVLASHEFRVHLSPDQDAIVLDGPPMRGLLAAALEHPRFVRAGRNALLFSVTRTDSAAPPVHLERFETGGGATLETCFGRCDD